MSMLIFKVRHLALFGVSMLLFCETGSARDVFVDGYVFDDLGKPMPAVEIKVWRNGKPFGKPESTLPDGSYKIAVPEGERIDLEYSHSKMDPTVVEHLSGTKNHKISKILYPTGQEKPFGVAYQQLLDFESVAVLQLQLVTSGEVPQEAFAEWKRKDYSGRLIQFKIGPGSNVRQRTILSNKFNEVQKLYQTVMP